MMNMTLTKRYPWKRFWCPRGGFFSLDGQEYLADPELLPPYFIRVLQFDEIAAYPCLVLLGEPGIGKSLAMGDAKRSLEATLRGKGESLLWVDLKSFGDEGRLLRKIFESVEFVSWIEGKNLLHIFLDSLDECRLRVPQVAALLMEQLYEIQQHIGRLRFRIACRTAEWPSQLEEGLPELWGKEQVGSFELVPLRRKDVLLAAEIEGIADPEGFLSAIADKGAQPLAIKPVTLQFLLSVYRRDGKFPPREVDLYRSGCQVLVTEPSQSRQDAREQGRLSSSQRLVVAARIAAVSMFCNRSAIYLGKDPGEASMDDVRVDELAGSTESADGNVFPVGEREIREVLETGLFSSRGPYRLGFAHQTYSEFLAAHYLVDRRLETKQILALVQHPELGGAIVPQLAETSAWLAAMKPEIFREILMGDPKVLLRSDVAQASREDKAALVGGLLDLFAAQEITDDSGLRDGYRRLSYPGISRQLEPFLVKKPDAWLVRRVAIDIAESCKCTELLPTLVQIALDSEDFQPTRVKAAWAIARMGDSSTRKHLLPLALGVEEDDDDELKGVALRALWPDLISAKEVFQTLTPAKEERLIGSYRDFLGRHLLVDLKKQELPEALRWVQEQPKDQGPRRIFRKLANEIIIKGLEYSCDPEVLDSLVAALVARGERYDYMQDTELASKMETLLQKPKRRDLVEAIMDYAAPFDAKLACLLFCGPSFLQPQNFEWLLLKSRTSTSDVGKKNWAQVALRVFSVELPGHAETMLTEAVHSPVVAEVFKGFVGSIALESEEAMQLRRHFELINQGLRFNENQGRLLEPSPKARIEMCLGEFDQGDLDAWWRLSRQLTLEATSTHYGDELEPFITRLPGWTNSDPAVRSRIIQAARVYVTCIGTNPKKWFGKNTIFFPDFAGYKALCLLAVEEPAILEELPSEVWERWIPIILGYPLSTYRAEDALLHAKIAEKAYRQAPLQFLEQLNKEINLENRKHDHLAVLHRLSCCWDDRLTSTLLGKVKRPHLKATAFQESLEKLIQLRSAEAEAYAKSLVQEPIPQEPRKRARSSSAALALLRYATDAGWGILRKSIAADPAWGREVFEALGGSQHESAISIAQRLQEDEVAELYLWLAREYPHREDRETDGWIGPREGLAFFRDALIGYLRDRGTREACQQLERIVQSLPELKTLKFYLLVARQNMLRRTWIPPTPRDFLQLSRHSGIYLIRSADDLLDIIIESLSNIGQKLQGKPPMARYLWDGSRPMDEEALSDWVKLHLEQELRAAGIVALREVQIERGEKTDINVIGHVPGLEPDTWDQVSVIIETKGSWNRDVKTAMRDQLVDAYLKNNNCRHGIYLVGWYRCDAWDPTDYRSKVHKAWTWAAASQELAAQAKELSTEGRIIRSFLLDVRLRDKATV